jgi:hypothetical protein
VGETWTITARRTVLSTDSDPVPNTVTASGKIAANASAGLDEIVVAPDSSSVLTHSLNLFQPSFSISKIALDPDGTVTVGQTTQYRITITNTSSSDSPAMDAVSILDDHIGALAASAFTESGADDNALQVGETWTGVFGYTVAITDFPALTNIVTAIFQVQDVPSAGFDGRNRLTQSASANLIVDLPALPGRMTGGGSIFLANGMIGGPTGTRVTHGFQLHCTTAANNRLEVNWGKPNSHFHLANLSFVKCEDTPLIQAPPNAPIDTMIATGPGAFSGTFNGIRYTRAAATISFIFRDASEPGVNDTASYKVTLANGIVVLNTDSTDAGATPDEIKLTFGNHQAHREIPRLTTTAQQLQAKIDSTLNALDSTSLTEAKILTLTTQLLDLFAQYESALLA